MTRLLVSALAVALAAGFPRAQPAPHTASQTTRTVDPGKVVTGYQIPADMESDFDANANAPSCWWKAWDLVPALSKATLKVPDDISSGPTDKTVTALTARFAYSAAGCYVLWEVHDAEWVGFQNSLDYANDAVEFVVDQNSAEDLYTAPFDKFVNINYSQLTPVTCQLQIRFGGTADLPTTFSYNWFNPLMAGMPGLGGPTDFMLYNRTIDIATAEATYGIKLRWLNSSPSGTTDPQVRYQEWFFPWAQWGGPNNGGVSPPTPASPKRFAAVLGYNDLDGTTNDYTSIRWRNQCSPWTTWLDPGTNAYTSLDCWGDIVFADALTDVLAAAGKTVADLGPCPTTSPAKTGISRSGRGRRDTKEVRYFTISGKTLTRGVTTPASILIERSALVNGATQTRAVSRAETISGDGAR